MRRESLVLGGRAVLSVVAPPRCGICAAACAATDSICPRCALELRAARSGSAPLRDLEALVWAAPYEGTPRALVSALKFGHRLALAELAAEAIAPLLEGHPTIDAVVPVPPAPLRRRLRGFDPAELIASRLAATLEFPLSTCLVRRDHRRQVGKSRTRRLADPPGIRARDEAPQRPLLVDDVFTTGATLTACARALRGAGSRRVEAAVYARSL